MWCVLSVFTELGDKVVFSLLYLNCSGKGSVNYHTLIIHLPFKAGAGEDVRTVRVLMANLKKLTN